MSLLLEHGHVHAQSYPIGMVWTEAAIVQQRLNEAAANQAVLTQSAVASLLSTKAGSAFRETLKALRDEDDGET